MNSTKRATKTVAILLSVRDEETYIDLNISYHLDLGIDYIFIANHCSTDNTNKILNSYRNDPRVIVMQENDPIFDHAKITNKLLKLANSKHKIDWFIFLDADEFLSVKDKTIHNFIARLEKNRIPYATIGWANALFDYTLADYTCSAVHPIDTMKYYLPWPEKSWQDYGHFRKAIVKNHKNMEVVVGGHYVRTENNPKFFGSYHLDPFIVPKTEASILHFEFRERAEAVYEKWGKLASFENDSTSKPDSPWLERIRTIKKYVKDYKHNIIAVKKRWFFEHRTFWGTIIPKDRIIYDTTLILWYGKYFRRQIERKKIKSVCLVRSGHLGDVIMTEPIARFVSKHIDKVYLATKYKDVESILGVYDKVYRFSEIKSGRIDSDIMVKLIYELSDNRKTYIQGYMQSIGFGGVQLKESPRLKHGRKRIIREEYILISPFTSSWEEKKRSWGYGRFLELSNRLESELKIKCVILKKHYSFNEMISLIEHCKYFVGNDSAPAVIAESYKKPTFVIFGATLPNYKSKSKKTIPIYDQNRHKLCKHTSRQQEIDCCEEFCMDKMSVDNVFDQIMIHI